MELVKIACKNNEFIARYIGTDFHVETNKKLRSLRKRFLDGVDDRIVIVSISPLVLEWRKNDQTDQTDHNAQQKDNKYDSTDNISSDTHSSGIHPVRQDLLQHMQQLQHRLLPNISPHTIRLHMQCENAPSSLPAILLLLLPGLIHLFYSYN